MNMNMNMNMNRFASINRASLENQYIANRRRNNINNIDININNNSFSFNYNKMKILILIIITFIMSLSNYFYTINNAFNLVEVEPRTILSFFESRILKLNGNDKKGKLRNLKQEDSTEIPSNDDKFKNNKNNNTYKINELLHKNIKKRLFNDIDKYDFKCSWKSFKNKSNSNLYKIGDSFQGEGLFNIKKKIESYTGYEFIVITMKNKEGNYIDNWIYHSSISIIDQISIDKNNKNNTLEIEGKFITNLFKGELFSIINEDNPEFCQTNIKISFPLDDQTYLNNYSIYVNNLNNYDTITLNPNNFSLIMESSCGFNFVIKANIFQYENEQEIREEKMFIYSLISIISSLFYIIGIYSIIYNIKKYDSILSSISSDCFSINPVWNTYICLANVNLYMKYNITFYSFITVVFLSAMKFFYFDFWLLAIYWTKRRRLANVNIFKEKLRFYLIYYFFLFFSFLFINTFFINYIFIMILCILLWIPQIIFNLKTNNKYGYPFIFILSTTIDKLIYPIYFRGYNNNFIEVKTNVILIFIMISFVILTIIVLYIQVLKDPRFMLFNSNNNKYNFFKNKEELLTNIGNNVIKEECVICLLPILQYENDITIEMKDKSITKEIKEDKLDLNDKKEENNENNETNDISNISVNSEIEKFEDNENEIDIQDKPFISSDIIKLNKENDIGNNNINILVEKRKNISLLCKIVNNNLKFIFLKKTLFVFKILFFDNFFSFYKKSLNSNGKLYMLTPCNHIFHSECLVKWLEYKQECPNCRTSMKQYL